MRTILYTFLLLALFSCASLKRLGSTSVPTSIEPVSIIFSSNRYGALESTHSVFKQLGGMNREWNLAQKWMKASMGESLYLAAGTSFVPIPKEFDPRQKEIYLHRAAFIVEALNRMKLTALSPSVEDFALGHQALMEILKSAKFQLVSSNLYESDSRRPLFNTYLRFRHEGLHIYILGIAAAPDPKYPRDPSLYTLSAREAIATVLEIIPREDDRMIMVLSNVSEREREKLMREFPEIHVILGADRESTTTFNAKHWTGTTLYLNPQGEGRALSLMELDLKKPVVRFYNPSVAGNSGDLRPLWQARVEEVAKELSALPAKSERRAELERRRGEYEDYYKRLLSIPPELTDDSIPFRSTTVELDDDHQLPENEVSELIRKYREGIPRSKPLVPKKAPEPPPPGPSFRAK